MSLQSSTWIKLNKLAVELMDLHPTKVEAPKLYAPVVPSNIFLDVCWYPLPWLNDEDHFTEILIRVYLHRLGIIVPEVCESEESDGDASPPSK
jgi:hypothetical protein